MKLDKEEKEFLQSYNDGEWESVDNFEERKRSIEESAHSTLKKNKRLNIRISERDLNQLKLNAVKEGLPYQTYVSSILHKFINGKLIERNSI